MANFSEHIKTLFFVLIILQIAPPIIRNLGQQYMSLLEPQTQVAYLPIKGILYDSAYYRKYLKKYFEDSSIKAILLHIESPGAAAGTAEAIAQEISYLKKENPKPIITRTENICTSGAYYIGANTDWIIALPSTLIGSIGSSIPYQFKVNEALDQLKIKYNKITSGVFKSSTDPFVATTPEQVAMLQDLCDSSYANFVEHVSKHRQKVTLETANNWANGKIFSGLQAEKLNLIDQIGSQSAAEKKIRELAIIEGKITWVQPETKGNLFQALFGGEQTELQGGLESAVHTVCSIIEQRYTQSM